MAIIPGRQKAKFSFISTQTKKQKKLIWALLGLVVAMVAVYFMYVKKISLIPSTPTVVSPVLSDSLSAKIVEMLRSVNLSLPLLNDKNFQLLILPGNLPIVPGEKGRTNPFAPF